MIKSGNSCGLDSPFCWFRDSPPSWTPGLESVPRVSSLHLQSPDVPDPPTNFSFTQKPKHKAYRHTHSIATIPISHHQAQNQERNLERSRQAPGAKLGAKPTLQRHCPSSPSLLLNMNTPNHQSPSNKPHRCSSTDKSRFHCHADDDGCIGNKCRNELVLCFNNMMMMITSITIELNKNVGDPLWRRSRINETLNNERKKKNRNQGCGWFRPEATESAHDRERERGTQRKREMAIQWFPRYCG